MGYKDFQKKRIQSGFCFLCGNTRGNDGTKTMCRKCSSAANNRNLMYSRSLKVQRKCVDCAKELSQDDGIRCPQCALKNREASKEIQRQRVRSGRCGDCGSEVVIPEQKYPICQICYFKKTSRHHWGTRHKWQSLRDIWEHQNGICPYTGHQLTLGIDASLDHIFPVSRFPELKDSIDNLQWVYHRVNEMKDNLTHDEFLAFISKIVKHLAFRR